MKEIIIRKATLNDIDTLLKFEQGVIGAERPYDPALRKEAIYYDLKFFIEDPSVYLIVAEHNNKVIASGYARIKEAESWLQHEFYSYLGFMYVEPEYRRMGVNKMIIDALKDWSRSKNMTEIRLEVYHGNEPAMYAYEKVGFEKYIVEMRMSL